MVPVNYEAPFPGGLHPAEKTADMDMVHPGIHWAKPKSWNVLTRYPADVVHFQHWVAPMAFYLLPLTRRLKALGCKIVVTVHNPKPHEALGWLSGPEMRWLTTADAIVVHDARGRKSLVERGIDMQAIHVIPHGITFSSTAEVRGDRLATRQPACEQRSRRYVLLFGNLRGYKGVGELLAAWRVVCKSCDDVDLVIAGRLWDGASSLLSSIVANILGTRNDAKVIRRQLLDHVLAKRVRLVEGFVPDDQLDALIDGAELAVFPYVSFASQSGAACRAAGRGCPVLVSDVGALAELAMSPNWIVSPADSSGLAAALIDRLGDVAQTDCRAAQRQHVRLLGWPGVAQAHVLLYQSLCSIS